MTYLAALSLSLCLGVSCDTELYFEECVYSLLIRYDYNEENTTTDNKILYWISDIDEYIFDDQGVLLATRKVTESICAENLDSEVALRPGRYSVLALGNVDGRSVVWDAATGEAPLVGQTRREDMRMTLRNAEAFPDGTTGPCEELYYGYRSFSVGEIGQSVVRVDMINAHFQLRFRVTWKNRVHMPDVGNYYAVMGDTPSQYELMPQYVYLPREFEALPHDPETQDPYLTRDNRVIHYIPRTAIPDTNILRHRDSTYLNADFEVWGTIVGYRIKSETNAVLNLYYTGDGDVLTDEDPMVFPHGIDLQQYFDWFQYDLDHELKQEYAIDIVIDGDAIQLAPLEGMSIADWSDGGFL